MLVYVIFANVNKYKVKRRVTEIIVLMLLAFVFANSFIYDTYRYKTDKESVEPKVTSLPHRIDEISSILHDSSLNIPQGTNVRNIERQNSGSTKSGGDNSKASIANIRLFYTYSYNHSSKPLSLARLVRTTDYYIYTLRHIII